MPQFDEKAYCYNDHAILQLQSAKWLLNFIEQQRMVESLTQVFPWGISLPIVLDAGAGTGFLSLALANKDLNVWAVDKSEPMLAQMPLHDNIETIPVPLENMPFPEQMVDLVVSNFCLHWCQPSILAELIRVTRVGGRLVLAIPVAGSLRHLPEVFNGFPIYEFLEASVWLKQLEQLPHIQFEYQQKEFSMTCGSLREVMAHLSQVGGTLSHHVPTSTWKKWLKQHPQTVEFSYRVLLLNIIKQ